jgi:hypothetical protein
VHHLKIEEVQYMQGLPRSEQAGFDAGCGRSLEEHLQRGRRIDYNHG